MARPPGEPREPGSPELPEVHTVARARWRLQLVWLVPLVALLVGGWLAVQSIVEKGPTVTIHFKTGEGLDAGKTKIKYKDVEVGVVKSVTLAPNHRSVVVRAELTRNASDMLVDDTRFWVVRPRISGGTVSGLGTLLSGSYIGMDAGTSTKTRHDFTGLEIPPVLANDVPGREFVLKAEDMGSLDVGSPIYFRRLQVGQIVSYRLDADGKGVTLKVFINSPYDRFVQDDTRFWQASGIDLSLTANGVKLNTESLVAILVGGLAFQSPPDSVETTQAAALSEFALYHDRTEAMQRHDRIVDTYVLNFKESVRGLTVGAPVDFRGIAVGEVAAIHTRFDREKMEFSIPVEIRFFPERFTSRYQSGKKGGRVTDDPHALGKLLVEKGLRGQLRIASLLTGQRYVALDFFPNAPKATMDWSANPPEVPTVPGGLQSLQDSILALVGKLERVPFEGIGQDLRQALQGASKLLAALDADVAPEAKATLIAARSALDSANRTLQPNSDLSQNANDLLRELTRTAASLRNLADYLERHPEALIRGKSDDAR
jgi:paraquat-inducible protein B